MSEAMVGKDGASMSRGLTVQDFAALCFCAFFMLLEGIDLAAMPLVVPRVSVEWGLPAADFAFSLSAVLIGIGAAAVLLAPLGERFGRRRMIMWSGTLTVVATCGTASAASVEAFALWRFLTGIGLGACLPNVTASVARIAPVVVRARTLAIVNTAIPVGSLVAGFLVAPIARIGNWQAMFWTAGLLTLVATAGLSILIPREQRSNVVAVEASYRRKFESPVFDLFHRGHRVKTMLLLGLATTNTFLIYMMINWLPTLLPRAGMSIDDAARLSSLFQLGGVVGGFFFAHQMDKSRAVATFVFGYVMAAAALFTMALTQGGGSIWILLLLAAGLGISGAHVAITIFGMIFYPHHLLSSFVGLSIAVTRSGAICGPLVGGWLIARTTGVTGFMLAALIPVGLCVTWVFAIDRAKKKGLMERDALGHAATGGRTAVANSAPS